MDAPAKQGLSFQSQFIPNPPVNPTNNTLPKEPPGSSAWVEVRTNPTEFLSPLTTEEQMAVEVNELAKEIHTDCLKTNFPVQVVQHKKNYTEGSVASGPITHFTIKIGLEKGKDIPEVSTLLQNAYTYLGSAAKTWYFTQDKSSICFKLDSTKLKQYNANQQTEQGCPI